MGDLTMWDLNSKKILKLTIGFVSICTLILAQLPLYPFYTVEGNISDIGILSIIAGFAGLHNFVIDLELKAADRYLAIVFVVAFLMMIPEYWVCSKGPVAVIYTSELLLFSVLKIAVMAHLVYNAATLCKKYYQDSLK